MTTAIQKTNKSEKAVEFTPFGAADRIKLTIKIVQDLVAVPTRTGKTCSERDAIKFMALCQAQRLNPFAGDAFLTGYDNRQTGEATFSLITAHQAFLKRAESNGDYEGMESGIIFRNEDGKIEEREGDFFLPEETVVGGWAKVYRKDRKPMYRRLSIAQRKPAYDTPFWSGVKAAEQIVKCAEADALRATFPTLLAGLHIDGEAMANAIEVVSDVTEKDPVIADTPAPKKRQIKETAEQSAGVAAPAPETKQPETTRQSLERRIFIDGKVNFDDFTDYLVTQNIFRDAKSVASIDDVPTAVWDSLAANENTVTRIIRTYGSAN